VCVFLFMYIYIIYIAGSASRGPLGNPTYIHRERERGGERERDKEIDICV